MSKFPVYYAGQRLTSTLLTSGQEDTYTKDVNQTRVSTTAYANDDELQGIALAIGEYDVHVGINMVGGAGGIAIKTQWTFTGTWNTPIRQVVGPSSSNTASPGAAMGIQRNGVATNADAVYGLSTSGAYSVAFERCIYVTVTVAGTLALSWAPNVNSATSGGVRLGSWITVRRTA